MSAPQVWFLGYDWYALGYVTSIPEIYESKGFGRGQLTPSSVSLTFKNFDNMFSEDNPISILNGIKWQYDEIVIYDLDGNEIFCGMVQDIICDDEKKTALLKCKDIIFKDRKTPISYNSSDWEEPGAALLNIYTNENFTNYNEASLQKSINLQSNAGCYIKVNINKSDNISIFDIIQKISKYSCADSWVHLNNIYYQQWAPYTGGVSFSVEYSDNDDCPISAPKISRLENDFFNDYSLTYNGYGGTAAIDSANNNIALGSRNSYGTIVYGDQRSDTVSAQQIAFKDLTTAVYVGESYINRGHFNLKTNPRPRKIIEHELNIDYKSFIEIGAYYKLTYADQGWNDKVFEIFEYKQKEDSQIIKLKSLEVTIG